MVSCARIGESPVSSLEEKRRVYEISGKAVHDAGKVHIAAIAPQSTDEAVSLMRDLENLPVDGVMIFPPLLFAWGKVDPNLKVRFFEDLARETKLPVVLFQMPVKSYYYDPETDLPHRPSRKRRRIQRSILRHQSVHAKQFKHSSATKPPCACSPATTALSPKAIKLGANGALIGVANVATEKWARHGYRRSRGQIRRSRRDPERARILKELVFSEPIVEAVARIKIVLQHEGLIKTAKVRRPQLGISEAEKKQLLDSYAVLKRNEFRNGATTSQDKRRQAVGQ